MATLTFATSILTRAVTLDTSGRYTEALICYQEGLQILMESLKAMTMSNEEEKRVKLRAKVQEYMERAEKLKGHIEALKMEGKYKEQIKIKEDSIRHSYDSVFSRFLDMNVQNIEVDDSYIRSAHQCDNFLRFTELCVKRCPNLKSVVLTTGTDPKTFDQQSHRLRLIAISLQTFEERNIQLRVNYSESMHDREIRVDTGWVIKIGRGLDYFKPVDRLALGWSDYDLRPCKETTVDIFHRKELARCH